MKSKRNCNVSSFSAEALAAALLPLVLSCCAAPAEAQNPSTRYAVNFAEAGPSQASAIVADSEGDAFVTGQSCVDAGCIDQEAVTIKYDPTGKILWKSWLKSPIGFAQGIDIGMDSAGNTYVLFVLWQTRDSSSLPSAPDVVTAKYDSAGVRQWINYFSSTATVTRTPVKLAVSPDGNVYVTTIAAQSPANTAANAVTIKYDTTGKTVWMQTSPPVSNSLSAPLGIHLDAQENVYVLVKSSSPTGSPASSSILKYSTTGTQLKTFGSQQLGDAVAFQVSAAGNSYALGFAPTITAGDTGDVTLAKFSTDGILLWSNDLGSTVTAPKAPQPVAITLDPKEDVFLASTVTGTAAVCGSPANSLAAAKFNSNGMEQWNRTFPDSGSSDTPTAIVANSIGDLYVVGKSESSSAATCAPQILTIKFSIPGNVMWSQLYQKDAQGDTPASLAIGGQGGLFIAGTAHPASAPGELVSLDYVQDGGKFDTQSVAFGTNPSPNTVTLTNIGESDLTNISFEVQNEADGTFSIFDDECSGATLAPGASCQFSLSFSGGQLEPEAGAVLLHDNWEGSSVNPQQVFLSFFMSQI